MPWNAQVSSSQASWRLHGERVPSNGALRYLVWSLSSEGFVQLWVGRRLSTPPMSSAKGLFEHRCWPIQIFRAPYDPLLWKMSFNSDCAFIPWWNWMCFWVVQVPVATKPGICSRFRRWSCWLRCVKLFHAPDKYEHFVYPFCYPPIKR